MNAPQHQTGQWFASTDGGRWWFDSGALCLNFAYTGSMSPNAAWERMLAPDDLAGWLAPRFERLDARAGTRDLVGTRELIDALALRAAVGSIALTLSAGGAPDPDAVDTVNLFAATPDIPPVLAGGGRQAGHSSVRVGQALSTIARDAVALFGETNSGDAATSRLRICAADDCGLVFYDESRSNNRRWCSMQRCGNRSKVRAHRARASAR